MLRKGVHSKKSPGTLLPAGWAGAVDGKPYSPPSPPPPHSSQISLVSELTIKNMH